MKKKKDIVGPYYVADNLISSEPQCFVQYRHGRSTATIVAGPMARYWANEIVAALNYFEKQGRP